MGIFSKERKYKRKPKARIIVAAKAETIYNQYEDRTEDISNKLGISSGVPREKIIFELNKLKNKQDLRKILKLTDEDFKRFGIE